MEEKNVIEGEVRGERLECKGCGRFYRLDQVLNPEMAEKYSESKAKGQCPECGGLVYDRESVKEGRIRVMLMPFGQMATFQDKEQRTDLQHPWIELVAEYFESKGEDPTLIDFMLPTGHRAEVFRIPDGFNWRLVNERDFMSKL